MAEGQFWVGRTEEHFSSGPYDTREEAIASAKDDESLGPGDEFWVGVEKAPKIPRISAVDLLETLRDGMWDEYAEVVLDGWPNASEEAVAELGRELNRVFSEWHREHASFGGFVVEDAESRTVPGKAEE